MGFRILESRMYRDPMLVLEAKQEAEPVSYTHL